jgi:murein DD-endopeptidase MepM/ murein hydrolase activator NlpD
VFGSPFGGRRHPILGYVRMHTGVVWRAPRGSPILAAGNGVVEKAGWANGYGNQTIIRHANGYQTSYNHQNAIASGITPGTRVRQGQLIGYVGSTGLSTGPHLHYEVIVNGAKVDPMRIRMPQSQSLNGKQLEVFMRERNRIDQLLDGKGDTPPKVANSSQAKSG